MIGLSSLTIFLTSLLLSPTAFCGLKDDVLTPKVLTESVRSQFKQNYQEIYKSIIIRHVDNENAVIYSNGEYGCQKESNVHKETKTISDGSLVEEFTIRQCQTHWGTFRMTRKCAQQKPITIDDFFAGDLPAVENCQIWKLENSATNSSYSYSNEASTEKMDIDYKSEGFILNLKQQMEFHFDELTIKSLFRLNSGSEISEQNYIAQESSNSGLTKRYYHNASPVSPLNFHQSYESNFNSQFNVLLNIVVSVPTFQ